MRLVINGEGLSVTIKSETELTTQQVVMAHQLATGDYQALFVSDYSSDKKENNRVNGGQRGWVDVKVSCPECQLEGRFQTMSGNTFTKCPNCRKPLFNKFATEEPGETDAEGYVYIADEEMIFGHKKFEDNIPDFEETNDE